MNLILYTSGTDNASWQLVEMAIAFAEKGTAEIFHSLKNLTNRLTQPKNNQTAVVLHAANEKELTQILSINDFLQDVKLILILPNREKPTVAKGHRLYPRFLSYADSDFADIGAVLNKMFENSLSENK
jgi:hypothetical protein